MSAYIPFLETAWIVFQEQLELFAREDLQMIKAGDHVALREFPSETLGVVKEIDEDNMVRVCTPEWMVARGYCGEYQKEGWHETGSLIRTPGYSIQELARAIYGSMGFHSFCNVERSYFGAWKNARICCQHEECDKVALGVGLVNNWGTVMPFAMCLEHTEWNAMRCESVPFKGKVTEQVGT